MVQLYCQADAIGGAWQLSPVAMGLISLARHSSDAMRSKRQVQIVLIGRINCRVAGVSRDHFLQRVKLGGAPLSRTQVGSSLRTAGTSSRSSAARPFSRAKAATRGLEELHQYVNPIRRLRRSRQTCVGILRNLPRCVSHAQEVTTLTKAPPRACLVYEVNTQRTKGARRALLVNPDSNALATQSCSSLQ